MIYDCHGFPSFSSRPPELFGTGSNAAFRPYRAIQVALRYYCQLVLGLHKSEARISCVGGCVTGPGSGAIISYRWHGRGRNAGKIYVHVEQDMGSVGLDTRPANWISPPAAAPTHPKRFFFCSTWRLTSRRQIRRSCNAMHGTRIDIPLTSSNKAQGGKSVGYAASHSRRAALSLACRPARKPGMGCVRPAFAAPPPLMRMTVARRGYITRGKGGRGARGDVASTHPSLLLPSRSLFACKGVKEV
ncbi:hypothetical protein V8E53_012615 [Lactarius tabidus]